MIKSILILFFIFGFVLESFSQQEENPNFKDRIYFGGGFGAWFSDNYSYVELSPIAGYMITKKLSAGIGITYQYIDRRYYYTNGDSFKRSSNVYGGRLFARMNIKGPLFLYGEYETLSYEFPSGLGDEFNREWVPGLFLGAGFMQPMGRKGGIGVMILYNFQHDDLRSPYNSEWVYRFSFFI